MQQLSVIVPLHFVFGDVMAHIEAKKGLWPLGVSAFRGGTFCMVVGWPCLCDILILCCIENAENFLNAKEKMLAPLYGSTSDFTTEVVCG